MFGIEAKLVCSLVRAMLHLELKSEWSRGQKDMADIGLMQSRTGCEKHLRISPPAVVLRSITTISMLE